MTDVIGGAVLDILGWLIEQACRLADPQVCAFANLTDDPDTGGALGR